MTPVLRYGPCALSCSPDLIRVPIFASISMVPVRGSWPMSECCSNCCHSQSCTTLSRAGSGVFHLNVFSHGPRIARAFMRSMSSGCGCAQGAARSTGAPLLGVAPLGCCRGCDMGAGCGVARGGGCCLGGCCCCCCWRLGLPFCPLFPFVPSNFGFPCAIAAQIGRWAYFRFFSRFIGGSEAGCSLASRLSGFAGRWAVAAGCTGCWSSECDPCSCLVPMRCSGDSARASTGEANGSTLLFRAIVSLRSCCSCSRAGVSRLFIPIFWLRCCGGAEFANKGFCGAG